jgi:hypothetical protein
MRFMILAQRGVGGQKARRLFISVLSNAQAFGRACHPFITKAIGTTTCELR